MADAGLLNLVLYLPLAGMAVIIALPAAAGRPRALASLGVMLLQFFLAAWLYERFDASTEGLQFATRLPWIRAWGV